MDFYTSSSSMGANGSNEAKMVNTTYSTLDYQGFGGKECSLHFRQHSSLLVRYSVDGHERWARGQELPPIFQKNTILPPLAFA